MVDIVLLVPLISRWCSDVQRRVGEDCIVSSFDYITAPFHIQPNAETQSARNLTISTLTPKSLNLTDDFLKITSLDASMNATYGNSSSISHWAAGQPTQSIKCNLNPPPKQG